MGTLSANFGASDAYTVTLAWTEQSQSAAKNQTTLAVTCTLCSNRASAAFTGYARSDSLTIGSQTYAHSHGDFTVPGGGSVLLWSDTVTVTHDDDGTCQNKAVAFSVMIDTVFSSSGWIGAVEASGTMTLTAIPRATAMSFGAFTAGATGKITLDPASSSFTHTVSMTFGDVTQTLSTAVKTYLNWKPALSLLAEIPNSTSGKGTLTCRTYLSGTLVGTTSKSFTLYAPATVVPAVQSFAVSLASSNSVVSGWGVAVRTLTKLRWTAAASGVYGASITKYAFSATDVTGSGASGTTAALPKAGTLSPSMTVTDSRGRSVTVTADPVTVYDYSAPVIRTATARRCTADGTISDQGDCCKLTLTAACSSVGGRNSLTLRYRKKAGGGSWSAWTAITSGEVVTGFAPDTSYTVQLSAVDTVGSSKSVQVTVPTAAVALHVRDGGLGAAFGKYAEQDGLLESAWPMEVEGFPVAKMKLLHTFTDAVSGAQNVYIEGMGDYDLILLLRSASTGYSTTNLAHEIIPIGTNRYAREILNVTAEATMQVVQRVFTPFASGTLQVGSPYRKMFTASAAPEADTSYPAALSPYKVYGIKL